MNYKKIVTGILSAFVYGLFAQGTLPMLWNMDGADIPTGFSAEQGTGNKTYSSTNLINSAPFSLRLDNTGEWAEAHWFGRADTVNVYLAGTSTGSSWQGEVSIQESVDGKSWTSVLEFNNDLPLKITGYTVRVKSVSRFVRVYYTKKASGFNLALDDFEVRPKGASEEAEIELYVGNTKQINGGSIRTGNDTLIFFDVFNNGTKNALNVSKVSLSGAQADQFSVLSASSFGVPSKQKEQIAIRLNAQIEGSYSATLTVESDDSENPEFRLTFSTIKGQYASEPKGQAQNLVLDPKAFRMFGSFNKSDAESYLILASLGNADDLPADGESYQRGQYIGKSRVLYSGSRNENIEFDHIVANTEYQVRVFAFNGYGSYCNYLTSNPLQRIVTTPGLSPGSYYSTVSSNKPSFVSDLYDLINPHRRIFYSNYASFIIDQFEARDTTDNKKVLECFYTGFNLVYEPPFSFSVMSREHSYPQSYMTKVNDTEPVYSDLHLLFTVHQNNSNAVRKNYPLDIVETVSTTFFGGKFGRDKNGLFCYEPRDFAKGAAARANFYACAAYNTGEYPFTLPTSNMLVNEIQNQEILKKWHREFPPSEWEIARHEYIAQGDVQGNRNPFIDSPQWVCYIDFSLMKYDASGLSCVLDSIPGKLKKFEEVQIQLFPNPSSGKFQLNLSEFGNEPVEVYVLDFYERTLYSTTTNEASLSVDATAWANGNYFILARTPQGKTAVTTFLKQ
jgi:hypothetical protein